MRVVARGGAVGVYAAPPMRVISFVALPLRVLHAARRLGFLTDDASRVTACTMTGWKRLTTVRGQVFVRTQTPTQRPDLSVVR